MTSPRHPYRLTSTHAWADADLERHIADVVRLVLLTGPGERLHRREFGAGLGSAVFEPLDPASLVFTEARARGALTTHLGDRIEVVSLELAISDDSTLTAELTYRVRYGDRGRNLHLVVRR